MSRKKELSPEQRAECEAAKARYPDEEVSAASMHEVPIMGRVIWRGVALG